MTGLLEQTIASSEAAAARKNFMIWRRVRIDVLYSLWNQVNRNSQRTVAQSKHQELDVGIYLYIVVDKQHWPIMRKHTAFGREPCHLIDRF
jgi:hypothetical protein